MAKILLSWVSAESDFHTDGSASADGPTYALHQSLYDDEEFDKHIILTASPDPSKDEVSADLFRLLQKNFPGHSIKLKGSEIKTGTDKEGILLIAGRLINTYSEDELSIYVSSGTTSMRICWALAALNAKNENIRFIQHREKAHPSDKQAYEFESFNLGENKTGMTAQIVQNNTEKRLLTDGPVLVETNGKVYAQAKLIAESYANVLIYGEQGSGKGYLARFIHEKAGRPGPFVSYNCAAIPDRETEKMLFGETGFALFEKAKGGTLFLEQIGFSSSLFQEALTGFLAKRAYESENSDIRLIVSHPSDLLDLTVDGEFSQDLYYQLAIIEFYMPSWTQYPTNERKKMLSDLNRKISKEFGFENPIKLLPETKNYLINYSFPGNLRQIRNVLESVAVYFQADKYVKISDLPSRLRKISTVSKVSESGPAASSLRWEDAEKEQILRAMETSGTLKETREKLGYGSPNTLRKKMEKYGLENMKLGKPRSRKKQEEMKEDEKIELLGSEK